MTVERRRWRWSVMVGVVAALALVLAGPVGRAAADPDYVRGEASGTVNFGAADGFGIGQLIAGKAGWWVSCDIGGYWVTNQSTGKDYLHVFGGCRRGWAMNDGDLVVTTNAGVCGALVANVGNVDDPDETAVFDVVMVRPPEDFSGNGCEAPSSICAAVDGETPVCKAWGVGAPPGAGDWEADLTGCPWVTPTAPVIEDWFTEPVPSQDKSFLRWRATFEVAPVPDSPALPSGWTIRPYVVFDTTGLSWGEWAQSERNFDTYAAQGTVAPTGVTTTTWATPQGSQVQAGKTWTWTGLMGTAQGGSGTSNSWWNANVGAAERPKVVGLGYALWTGSASTGSQGGVAWPPGGTTRPPMGYGDGQLLSPGPGGMTKFLGGKFVGIHAPQYCSWYWGTKIADTTGSADIPDGDEPAGPVGGDEPPPTGHTSPPVIHVGPAADCPPDADVCIDPSDNAPQDPPSIPDPDDESCDFSITNPSTWGGQIICALVAIAKTIIKAIGKVVDAIAGLVGGLVSALLNMLETLFVPDGALLESRIDGVKNALTGGTVGYWIESVSGTWNEADGSVYGCEGPPIDLSALGAPGLGELKPFAACSGKAAEAASLVRTVASVGIGLSGGFAIARMFLSALGIRVGVPGGRGGDGS